MNILDIFYNQIVNEASVGEIDAFFKYNIIFSTNIVENDIMIDAKNNNSNVFIPTLVINDKKEFDRLLVEFINCALKFYDDFDDKHMDEFGLSKDEFDIVKVKTMFVNLFSNATFDDFNNPCEYLRKRIDFFNNNCEQEVSSYYSDFLKSNVSVLIKKDVISNETPYKFCSSAVDNNGDKFYFPSLKFGISNGKAYVYAIQNDKVESTSRIVNRALYKVGSGFDSSVDNESIYEDGNLKDITASFLVAADMFVAYLSSIGIDEIIIPSFLVERWNAKEMSNNKRLKNGRITIDDYEQRESFHESLQNNLTQKLLRTFLRLSHHYPNFDILSYPGDGDLSLYMSVQNQDDCNNELLLECNRRLKEKSHNLNI